MDRNQAQIKCLTILMVLAIAVSLLSSRAFAAEYEDIKGHWAEAQIKKWLDQGQALGFPD